MPLAHYAAAWWWVTKWIVPLIALTAAILGLFAGGFFAALLFLLVLAPALSLGATCVTTLGCLLLLVPGLRWLTGLVIFLVYTALFFLKINPALQEADRGCDAVCLGAAGLAGPLWCLMILHSGLFFACLVRADYRRRQQTEPVAGINGNAEVGERGGGHGRSG